MVHDRNLVLSQCCCCCSLRCGSITIGVLSLVVNLAVGALSLYAGIVLNGNILIWLNLVLAAIGAVLAALLLYGIFKKIPAYLRAWVYITTTAIVIYFSATLVIDAISGTLDYYVLCAAITGALISGYFILVVRSLALEMKDEEEATATATEEEMAPTVNKIYPDLNTELDR